MKKLTIAGMLAVMLGVAGMAETVFARCCGADRCARRRPGSFRESVAEVCCAPTTCQRVVYEQKQYTCYRTCYEPVCEKKTVPWCATCPRRTIASA